MMRSVSAVSSSAVPSTAPVSFASTTPYTPGLQPRGLASTTSAGPLLASQATSSVSPALAARASASPGPARAIQQAVGSAGPVMAPLTPRSMGPVLAAGGTPVLPGHRSVTPPRSVTPTGRLVRVISATGMAASTGLSLQAPPMAPAGTLVAAGVRSSTPTGIRQQVPVAVEPASSVPAQRVTGTGAFASSQQTGPGSAAPSMAATPASSFGPTDITNPVEGPRLAAKERSLTPRRDALVAALPAVSAATAPSAEVSRIRSEAVSNNQPSGVYMAPPFLGAQALLPSQQSKPGETAVLQVPPPASEALAEDKSLQPVRAPTQAEEARFAALQAARQQGATATLDARPWVNSSTTQLLPAREEIRRSSSPDALSPYTAMAVTPGAGLLRPWELAPTMPNTFPLSQRPASPGLQRPPSPGLSQRPPSPGFVQPIGPAWSPPPTVGVLPIPKAVSSASRSGSGSPLGSRGSRAGSPPGSPGAWPAAAPVTFSSAPLQVPQGLYTPSPPPTAPASPSMPRGRVSGMVAAPHAVSPILPSRSLSPPPSRRHPGSSAASVAAAAAAAVHASSPADGLAREVAAHEVELHVLRSEVSAREAEAENLRIRLKDTDAKLVDASGDVDTMSVKVETMAGNRHAVLKASAQQLEDQVEVLQKRLLLSEVELVEKDKEILTLSQAVGNDQQMVARQQHALDHLHYSQMEHGEKARWLAEHEGGLKRRQALDVWQENVRVNLNKENADLALQREQRATAEQCESLSAESAATRQFILNLEQQCRRHTLAMEAEKKKLEELLMEERLSESTAKIGQQAAHTQVQSQLAEMEGLEVRLQREVARKSARLAGAQAYSQHEVKAMRHMEELMSLTECMREITNVLRDAEQGSLSKDPIQRAVDEEVKLLRHIGGPVPPMVRINGDEYLIGGELMHCAAVEGRLHVRPQGADGMFLPMEEFVRRLPPNGLQNRGPPGTMPALYGTPVPEMGIPPGASMGGRARSASPAPPRVLGREPSRQGTPVRSLSRRPSLSPARGPPPGPGMSPAMAGARSWGMPALVAPVSIGAAEPFIAPAW